MESLGIVLGDSGTGDELVAFWGDLVSFHLARVFSQNIAAVTASRANLMEVKA